MLDVFWMCVFVLVWLLPLFLSDFFSSFTITQKSNKLNEWNRNKNKKQNVKFPGIVFYLVAGVVAETLLF